jgi:hypothetical protein
MSEWLVLPVVLGLGALLVLGVGLVVLVEGMACNAANAKSACAVLVLN